MMARGISRRVFIGRTALTAMGLPWLIGRRGAQAFLAPAEKKALRGIFAILQTPFKQNDEMDEEDLEREVQFCVRAGAHGIVWPQLAGEFYLLSEGERLRGAEVILHAVGGHLPVVIGVQAPSQEVALKFARHAEEKGADALIALPPFLGRVGLDTVGEYYRALVGAVNLPIFIQNTGEPWGPALPTIFVIKLAKENPRLGYIKEEISPVARRMAEYIHSGVMTGIFSGSAGRNLLNELARGSSGTMPACEFVDVDAQIYALASAGNTEAAYSLFEKLLPMINLEETYGLAFMKAVLVRRRVFKTAKLRGVAAGGLDSFDERELDYWWKGLAPYLKA